MNEIISNLQNPILRGQLLKLCSLADQTGIGDDVAKNTLIQYGFDVSERDVINAFCYLKDKGLIRIDVHDIKVLGFKRNIAYITSAGIDVIENRKVVEGVEL